MSTEEVEESVQQFFDAATRVREGGLDGVELLVGLGYLVAGFLSPDSNRRTDKYGGATIEERMTFLYEIVEGCRKALGPDLLLGIRMYDDMVDYSVGMSELKTIAPLLERTSAIDYLNVWQGAIPDPKSFADHWPSYYREPGQYVYKANEIKQTVGLPIIGAGRIDSPALAERLVADGVVDMVGMVRALIADPHLPNKAKEGRSDEIRYCIGTNQSCAGHILIGLGVGCIYNPVTGREKEWSTLPPAPEKKKVVIAGGGPAGMEAARTAAMRGHDVVLFEKGPRLGGQLNPDNEDTASGPLRGSYPVLRTTARQAGRRRPAQHRGHPRPHPRRKPRLCSCRHGLHRLHPRNPRRRGPKRAHHLGCA